jgi:hypothetical protein
VALYQFLLGRGYILPDVSPTSTPAVANCDVSLPRLPSPFPALKRKATPLTGVDMIKVSTSPQCSSCFGSVTAWLRVGDALVADE